MQESAGVSEEREPLFPTETHSDSTESARARARERADTLKGALCA